MALNRVSKIYEKTSVDHNTKFLMLAWNLIYFYGRLINFSHQLALSAWEICYNCGGCEFRISYFMMELNDFFVKIIYCCELLLVMIIINVCV